MISFSDCDFASNEPEGVNPTLPSASALFGSLGLMVATMNLGEDEASACAPQSGASEPSRAKTMQRTTTSWSILNGRFNCGFATKPDIPSGKAYYRTDSLVGCHRTAFRAYHRQSVNYYLCNCPPKKGRPCSSVICSKRNHRRISSTQSTGVAQLKYSPLTE